MGLAGKILKVIYEGDVAGLVGAQKELGKVNEEMAGAIKSSTSDVAQNIGNVGSTLTKTLTPIAATITGITATIGRDWRATSKEMQVQTGATGDELDKLMKSVQHVAGTVKGSLPEIGNVMSDIASKTELTGKPLEDLTRQILALKNLGTDLSGVQVAATFGGWGIEANKMGDALDRIFKISQESGVQVGVLMDRLQQYRPVLQGLGFDYDTASLLVTKLSDAMMPGLKVALAEVAKANSNLSEIQIAAEKAQVTYNKAVEKHGEASLEARAAADKLAEANALLALALKSPEQALKDWISQIATAKTDQEGLAAAIDIFGSKAGPAWASAIRSGGLELGGLAQKTKAFKGEVVETDKETRSFLDNLSMWKTKASGWIGPMADTASLISTVATSIGPAVTGVGKLVGHFTGTAAAAVPAAAGLTAVAGGETAAGAASAAAAPGFWAAAGGLWATVAPILAVIAVIALIAGAVYLVVTHWDTIKAATGAAWDWVKEHIGTIIRIVLALITGGLSEMVIWVVTHWDTIKAKTGAAWDWIKDHIGIVMRAVLAVITGGLSEVVIWVVTHWDQIRAKTSEIWNGVRDFVSGVWGSIKSTASSIFNGIRDAITGAINSARDGVSTAVNAVIGFFSHLWERATYYVKKVADAIKSLPFVPGSPIPLVVWTGEAATGMDAKFAEMIASAEKAVAGLNRPWDQFQPGVGEGFGSGAPARAAGAAVPAPGYAPMAHIENLNVTVQDPASIAGGISRELGWTLTGISRGRAA